MEATHSDNVVAGSCEGEWVITRTWSLVDDCSNAASTQEQTITVQVSIVTLYGLFPLVCYAIGAFLFRRFKLDEAEHAKIRDALDARAAERIAAG
jgi:Na+/melibiose symporter-like transporter